MKPIPVRQPDYSEYEQGHEQRQEDMKEHTHSPLETHIETLYASLTNYL